MKAQNKAKGRLTPAGRRTSADRVYAPGNKISRVCSAAAGTSKYVRAQPGSLALQHRDHEPDSVRYKLRGRAALAVGAATRSVAGVYALVPREDRGILHGSGVHFDPDTGSRRGSQEPRARARPP
jgi:hypothetical protein